MENKTNELKAKNLNLEKMINYQDGSVVSRRDFETACWHADRFCF